ncbi:MAG: CheR family methyltransferase, partial [Bordetella sp.]|nr:CheR family methyltransferase [Bordetella sp.]
MTDFDPDHAEQDSRQELDDPIPSRGYGQQPVVGIGGSSGAIDALQVLLASVPPDSGLAYVVILHLSRDHESTLAELLQRSTPMRVIQVQHDQRVEPDTVYVIPPRYALRTMDGQIQLADLPQERHRHVAVDLFFRALADTHGPHAVAVVLSGADGDGASGIKRIKERGGLTIVQDPQEAGHGGMPRSAIATGMVDWVLPVAEMGARIVDYVRREQTVRLPPEQEPVAAGASGVPMDESALRDVLNLLKTRTGRDFSNYKRATILRRIGRRMQVNAVEDMGTYLACLRTRPGEAAALLQDLLITVTNFFRDAECFAALEEHIPELFKDKGPSDTVRVWVAACATGEEAYSMAMLLSEYARGLDAPPAIQVFASDLDDEAIRVAREAIYPPTIEGDVSEERLRRFFVREHRGYRVRRELREMVLFAAHDLLKDSPFSRLDLVSCRNLLIYLNREAQTRVLDTFHFALRADALLFLGSSESVEDASSLFSVVDKRRRLFRKRPARRVMLPVSSGPGSLALALEQQSDGAYGPVVAAAPASGRPAAPQRRPPAELDGGRSASWGELHFRLIDHLAPPSILVDEQQDILHLSAAAGHYLFHGGGEPSRNLMRVIHPALRIELRAALYRAAQSGETAEGAPVVLELEGERKTIAVRIQPVGDIASGLQLVILRNVDDVQALDLPPAKLQGDAVDPVAEHLDQELERLKSHLRDTVEQYEASTEELKASNEELQAMNEELRSASEELETSREELQSINEELTTVNHELKSNVDELAHANSDMHNLMDATAIATIFLDRDLRITRYTPSARTLFKLIPTDVGRPLSDLTTELDYPALGDDARRVLDRLIPVETEVGKAGDGWFLVRVLPYRTLDDHIAGVVLTFVDISELKQAQEALRASEDRFGAIVNEAAVGVVQADPQGLITYTNRFYAQMLGYDEGELRGRNLLDLIHPDDREISRRHMEELARHHRPLQFEKRCLCKGGAVIWLHNSVSLLAGSQPVATLVVSTDISERKRAEAALRASEERMRLVLDAAVEYAIFTTDPSGRITTWNPGAQRLLGYAEAEVIGQRSDLIFVEADRREGAPAAEIERAVRDGRAADDRLHQRKDGSQFWASGALMPMFGAGDTILGFVKILRDQSAQRAAQDALEASNRSKDRFLAVLSHELRNPLASVHGAALALAGQRLAEDEKRRAIEIVQRQADHMR